MFSTKVDGQVFAEPIVAGQTVIAATMNDWVYGLNAATGAVNWKLSLGAPFPTSTIQCDDATPNTGVMGTPVYDPSTGTVYVVAEVVPAGNDNFHPAFFMHALNAQTGAERPGWPVQIKGAPVNAPTKQFSAISEWQRPGLAAAGRQRLRRFRLALRLGAVHRLRGRGQHEDQGGDRSGRTSPGSPTPRAASGRAAAG